MLTQPCGCGPGNPLTLPELHEDAVTVRITLRRHSPFSAVLPLRWRHQQGQRELLALALHRGGGAKLCCGPHVVYLSARDFRRKGQLPRRMSGNSKNFLVKILILEGISLIHWMMKWMYIGSPFASLNTVLV